MRSEGQIRQVGQSSAYWALANNLPMAILSKASRMKNLSIATSLASGVLHKPNSLASEVRPAAVPPVTSSAGKAARTLSAHARL